jgi:radical SAM-linked protein
MARQPTGPPPAPAVQRLRIKYAKRGRLRFTSHRDFQRAFERALRRAGVPMAYSAGFSPHPKISYAGAAPTGAASEAEYLEIAVTSRCDPATLAGALDSALPAGLDVIEVVEAATPDLAGRLQASVWEIRLPGVADQAVSAAVTAFLAAESVEVERLTKHGMRVFDARAAVLALSATPVAEQAEPDLPAACAILHVVVRHTTPAVRPDDVLAGLRRVVDLAPPTPALVVRLAQGPLDEQGGAVTDPLAPDRDAAATAGAAEPTRAGSAAT